MSWVAVAIGSVAVGGSVYKAVSANQEKQLNKGFIEQNYLNARQKMSADQRYTAESQAESLNARGLGTSGYSPVHEAMSGGVVGAPVTAPHSVGEQRLSDTYGQFQLESKGLENERQQALKQNKMNYENTLTGAIVSGLQGVAGAAAGKADLSAAATMNAAPSPSPSMTVSGPDGGNPVADAMLVGSSFRGIHPTDPLNNPASSWNIGTPGNPGTTRVAAGEPNATFGV